MRYSSDNLCGDCYSYGYRMPIHTQGFPRHLAQFLKPQEHGEVTLGSTIQKINNPRAAGLSIITGLATTGLAVTTSLTETTHLSATTGITVVGLAETTGQVIITDRVITTGLVGTSTLYVTPRCMRTVRRSNVVVAKIPFLLEWYLACMRYSKAQVISMSIQRSGKILIMKNHYQ